jgi:hypothetical protein
MLFTGSLIKCQKKLKRDSPWILTANKKEKKKDHFLF